MSKLLPIGAAALALGVSTNTLRRREASGRLMPARTVGGQRRHDLAALLAGRFHGALAPRRTVACARVSSHDQKDDLARQQQVSFEEDLASDVLEIITVFSARLYGSRSRKNQKLIDGVRQAVRNAQC